MGSCCSALHQGDDLMCTGNCGNDLGRSSTKVSSVAVASNLQTEGEILRSSNLKNFSSIELDKATEYFSRYNMLGEGNFCSVYKGWIDEQSLEAAQPNKGMAIVVKKRAMLDYRGLEEFVAEVKFLGLFHHPNIVKLIGYCLEGDRSLLVYEFIPRGSLKGHLYRCDSSFQPLSWNLRMKVALGIAKGLAFLHDEAHVIYRDLKPSNILLDLNYNAKISGFHLAKNGPRDGKTHITTSTLTLRAREYADIEYLTIGHLTVKSDVYSFGVIFLEMLSGRRAVDREKPLGETVLVEWAMPYLRSRHRCLRVLDGNLLSEVRYKFSAVQKAFNLIVRCLSNERSCRPDMKEVVQVLEQLYNPKEDGLTDQANITSKVPSFK